jgi:hypothetical protein
VRVAAGAIARKWLAERYGVTIRGCLAQIGAKSIAFKGWEHVHANPFFVATDEVTDELGNRPLGWVPHWPIGSHQTEFAEHTGLPFEATQGGKASMYPEYMLEIQRLKTEEAAKKKK